MRFQSRSEVPGNHRGKERWNTKWFPRGPRRSLNFLLFGSRRRIIIIYFTPHDLGDFRGPKTHLGSECVEPVYLCRYYSAFPPSLFTSRRHPLLICTKHHQSMGAIQYPRIDTKQQDLVNSHPMR